MQGFRTGVLLVNTGTPDSTQTGDVRRYLRQFLMDPRVIDLPLALRWPLVNLVIAPFRAPKSAHAYEKIWTSAGSPLLVHARALQAGLQQELGPSFQVEVGMAVGNPSIRAGLELLSRCDRLVLVPLFPQYASATVGSVLEASFKAMEEQVNPPPVRVIPPFYAETDFLNAVVEVARPVLQEFQPDRLIYSFHGLPESQVLRSGAAEGRSCLTDGCCDRPSAYCYRNHCLHTAKVLQSKLGAGEVAFQSRLGRARWLTPSLEETIVRVAAEGSKRLAVIAPSFVADCLETIEEIGVRGAELFKEKGGESLKMVPAVNASTGWVQGLSRLIRGG